MSFTFRPIHVWPRAFTKARRASNFSATYEQTIELLEGELMRIYARGIVIQLALQDADIRRDGLPRAAARPEHPGVIVSFETHRQGALSMPCDAFARWQDNLRAIALSLEALRKVDRYSVTQSGEQYRGWQALPPASANSAPSAVEEARRFLCEHSGMSITADASQQVLQAALRAAMRKLHPDTPGTGSHELFVQLSGVYELLKEEAI